MSCILIDESESFYNKQLAKINSKIKSQEQQISDLNSRLDNYTPPEYTPPSTPPTPTVVVNPAYISYCRKNLYTINDDRVSITIPKSTYVVINDVPFTVQEDTQVAIPSELTPDTRKGQDLYVYACANDDALSFVISSNSTVPTGYDANNSRKIGGFHCLCGDVGDFPGHTLNGYKAGDILPCSRWDLMHRPHSAPEGMVYFEPADIWIDIYLESWDGSKLVSKFGAIIADGASSKKFHGELFNEELSKVKKFLCPRDIFSQAALGVSEQQSIKGNVDANTAGNHIHNNNKRIISNIGLEDVTGVLWQWGEWSGESSSDAYTDSVYNSSVDSINRGNSEYSKLNRILMGGVQVYPDKAGSRAISTYWTSDTISPNLCARGVSFSQTNRLVV